MAIAPEIQKAAGTPKPTTIIFRAYLGDLGDEKTTILLSALTRFFGQQVGVYRQSITVFIELPPLASSVQYLAQLEDLMLKIRLNISASISFETEFIYSRL